MPDQHSIILTAYEYDVLKNNDLIGLTCQRYLESAIQNDDEVTLLLTLPQLTDLIGYVAAEANHARSKRKSEDLNAICDYLEYQEIAIKHSNSE